MARRVLTSLLQPLRLVPLLVLTAVAAGCTAAGSPGSDGPSQLVATASPGVPEAGSLVLPAPRDLYRQAATLQTLRHLPAVQCESLSLNFTKIEFDAVAQQVLFQPTGRGFDGAAYMVLPFDISDLEDSGYPDMDFVLDGTKSQDDGTLKGYFGVANYSTNDWEWQEYTPAEGQHIATVPDLMKKGTRQQLIVCVVFVGGGVFNADSFDLRPVGSRWPAERIASWLAPDALGTHSNARWASDPYAEDVLRCLYVDTSTDTLYVGSANGGVWKTSGISPAGDKARNFSQATFGDGSVRVAYFEAGKFVLKVLSGNGSYEPASWSEEYSTPAGGGTPLNSSFVSLAEDPATHSPRLAFHDESLGGLRFAEPGSTPGELAVSIISDLPDVGSQCKLWLPANFRVACVDNTAGAESIMQFDFDPALGWTPTVYDVSGMPFVSPPGAMDAALEVDGGVWATYSCPHGAGLVNWEPDTKGGSRIVSKAVSKTFVMPHVLEVSGSILNGKIALDPASEPVIVAYQPQSREISFAQFDTLSGTWSSEVCATLNPDQDCDSVDLYLDNDDDGDGFIDAAVLSACREAAAQPGMMRWTLEVRVQRIEMR